MLFTLDWDDEKEGLLTIAACITYMMVRSECGIQIIEKRNMPSFYIEKSIEDVSIVDVYSFTGNTSGTGNHVECESKVTFNSDMPEDDVKHIFEKQYKYHVLEKKDGSYVVTVYGDAPFPDNIEGH